MTYDREVVHRAAVWLGLAYVMIPASAAVADEPKAPWLHPWLRPPPPDLDPILASGLEASADASGGTLFSTFSVATPMLSETGAFGVYVASTTKQALSVEAVETLNLVIDHVTPEFGMLGGGLRRIGRRTGSMFGTYDFERIAVGLALMSRGSNLDAGLGAELAMGFLGFSGSGLGVHLDGYAFESDFGRVEKMLVVSLGYVYSPLMGTRAGAPPAARAPERPAPMAHPCPDVAAYQRALADRRKLAVETCNRGPSDECNVERDRVIALNQKLTACLDGQEVGPPVEGDDDPPP